MEGRMSRGGPSGSAPAAGVNVPSAPASIVMHNLNPSELSRELEQEQLILKQLHSKIADQLHRLQVEEVVLKKQVESMQGGHEELAALQQAEKAAFHLSEMTSLEQMEALAFPQGEAAFKAALEAAEEAVEGGLEVEDDEDDDDMEDEDEATSSMRRILQSELGGNYHETVEAEIMQTD